MTSGAPPLLNVERGWDASDRSDNLPRSPRRAQSFAVELMLEGGAERSRNCRRVEVEGRIVNADTGAPFSYEDACVVRGASVQFDPEASADARAFVTALLTDIFDLP